MKKKTSAITIGIDLGDRKHAVCVLAAKGEVLIITEGRAFNQNFEFIRVLDRKPTNLGRDAGWELKKPLDTDPVTYQTEKSHLWLPRH
ncbi:MAG: hypothetical protein Q8Q59_01245 [Luteolibacter sp.]|jgi:hypothetical protein|nr:hypothetical protein [Luteolibacter sp.]